MSTTEALRPTGIVKWFSDERGYGFITPDDGSPDVFVHITAVKKSKIPTLSKDNKVSYEILDNKGRPNAINLARL